MILSLLVCASLAGMAYLVIWALADALRPRHPAPGQIPVAVVRLHEALPSGRRARRSKSSGPHLLPRTEGGHMFVELLCALGCGAIVLLLCAVLLSALGCKRVTKLLPECHDYEAVMASKALRHRCAMNAYQRGCDLGSRESCAGLERLRRIPPEALADLPADESICGGGQ